MRRSTFLVFAPLALVLAVSRSIGAGADKAENTTEATGQHRGYTNDNLFLRLDDDKEMTFLVRIPGDKDSKWHDQFATLSRITVTYHAEPGEKYPIATAIRQIPANKP